MNLSVMDKLTAGCNWAMAAASVLMAAYVILHMFAPPSQSQVIGTVSEVRTPEVVGRPAAPAQGPAAVAPYRTATGPSTAGTSETPAPTGRTVPPQSPLTEPAAGRTPAAESAQVENGTAAPAPPPSPDQIPPGAVKDF